jgi:hypothetical protein
MQLTCFGYKHQLSTAAVLGANSKPAPCAPADEAAQGGLHMVLRWRVGRKRALLAAITQLSATLAAHHKVKRTLVPVLNPWFASLEPCLSALLHSNSNASGYSGVNSTVMGPSPVSVCRCGR